MRINSAHAPHRHRLPTPCSPPVSSLTPLLTETYSRPMRAAHTQYGMTPLHWACEKGHAAVVDALIAVGANLEAEDTVREMNQ